MHRKAHDNCYLPANFTGEKYGLFFRLVAESDAGFIVNLRTNERNKRYIHSTPQDVNKQIDWIREYKRRENNGEDYYFIFYKNELPVGLARIHHITYNSFSIGSWVFSQNAPFECAIVSALIIREIAFELLEKEFERSIEGTHIKNKHVLNFNKMIGLKIVGKRTESMGDFYLSKMSRAEFYENRSRILKLTAIS